MAIPEDLNECNFSLHRAMNGEHAYISTSTAIVCSPERELDSEKLSNYMETSTTCDFRLGSDM